MTLFWLLFVVVLTVIAALVLNRRFVTDDAAPPVPAKDALHVPPPSGAKSAPREQAQKPAAAARAEAPADIGFQWDAAVFEIPQKSDRTVPPQAAVRPVSSLSDAQRARLRDRYLAWRFPGVARTAADLKETERIIQAARLYFEDRKLDRAIELLGLAIAQCPGDETLALARLEITFLMRSAALYVELANEFRRAHPASSQWAEVSRLGRAIAPGEAIFGATDGPRATDHYGPWPDMPNWMQAPWDLTAEVRATEFHQAMAHRAA
jgi:hypothetical protein